jgi:hypothetical protein
VNSQFNRLLLLFLLGLIGLSLVASFSLVTVESTATLFMFSFLFGSLIFQMGGSVAKKLGLIALGNIVGLFWNFVFLNFSVAGTDGFGKNFNIVYTIAYPILNLMWLIPYWSISLGVLPKMQDAPAEKELIPL